MTTLYATGYLGLALLASFYSDNAAQKGCPVWAYTFVLIAAGCLFLATLTAISAPKPIAFPSVQPHVAKGGR